MLLVFVESYGAVTYETPAIADGFVEPAAPIFARRGVRDRSRSGHGLRRVADVRRHRRGSPTLSLISGVEVRDQYAYTLVHGVAAARR